MDCYDIGENGNEQARAMTRRLSDFEISSASAARIGKPPISMYFCAQHIRNLIWKGEEQWGHKKIFRFP